MIDRIARLRRQTLGLSASAVALAVVLATPAAAQTTDQTAAPPPDSQVDPTQVDPTLPPSPTAQDTGPAQGATGSDIIVTGSRVVRDGYAMPTPVTVASTQELAQAAPSTIPDALNQLPAFRSSGRPQNVSVASTGSNGGSFLNLRALGSQRTLVLLDGRRIVPSSGSGVPDANILPQDLTQRVEIVTGGASAAYGSDAVAGVVNFILDTGFQGIKGSAQGGISDYGDGKSYKATLTAGTHFANDRGRAVFSGEYYHIDSIDDAGGRGWAEANWGIIPNTAGATPKQVVVPGVVNSHATFGGLITAGPLAGTQFLPDGSAAPFTYGTLRSSQFMVGGDGIMDFINLGAEVKRYSLYGRVGYDVVDGVELFAEASLGQSHTVYNQRSPANLASTPTTIFSGNAFLPQSLQDQMTAQDVASFTMGRIHRDFGPIIGDSTNRTWRGVVGVKADLGGGWKLDSYYEHGENRFITYTRGNLDYRAYYAAADVVHDASGNIVCRSTLQGLDPGCVAINLFGDGSPSQAAIDYVTGESLYDMTVTQDVASLSISGSPFKLWAGPVDVAFGAEYRREGANQIVDQLSMVTLDGTGLRGFPAGLQDKLGGWSHTNPQPISGSYDIKEAFLEVVVPLLVDSPLGKRLEFNGAVRGTDYSTSGSVVTWKLGGVYQIWDSLRLRATRSRDIRAANITELFTGSRQSSGNVREPGTGTVRNFVGSTQGNATLDPEKADTLTAGVVVQPSWFNGFSFSADYYNIKINGAIASFSAQETLDQCAAGQSVACDQVVDNNGIYFIKLPFLNLNSLSTSGVDFEASYRTNLGAGKLGIRGLLNYTDHLTERTATGFIDDSAGDVGIEGIPKWGGNLIFTYDVNKLSLFLQERFIGGGIYDRTLVEGVDIADNHIDPVFYTDATVRYKVLGQHAELFLTVNNLFNRDPPIAPQPTNERFRATNFGLYDALGRYWTAGVRFKF